MKKFALVLGGGAAKGFAHIGFLKVLEKHHLKPDLIVGTSMGALVGGVYAAGVSADEIRERAIKLNNIGSFSLFSTLFEGNLLNIKKVKKLLDSVIGSKTHDELETKFVSVVTNLTTGDECHFEHGLVVDSIIASISIPGLFPRLKIGDNIYCDGGLTNNLPEDVARELMPDAVIISVDVLGPYEKNVERLKFKTAEALVNASTLMTTQISNNKPQCADLRVVISQPTISQADFSGKTATKSINKGINAGHHNIEKILELLKD